MTEKQLQRRVRDAALALYEHLPTHRANDPRWRHEAFTAEVERIISDARREAFKEAKGRAEWHAENCSDPEECAGSLAEEFGAAADACAPKG